MALRMCYVNAMYEFLSFMLGICHLNESTFNALERI